MHVFWRWLCCMTVRLALPGNVQQGPATSARIALEAAAGAVRHRVYSIASMYDKSAMPTPRLLATLAVRSM